MRLQPLGGALCALLLAASANAATLHPAVQAQLDQLAASDAISVILYLEEAPVAELDAELQAEGASRKDRHTAIVSILQSQQRTQEPLKAWLDQALREGRVLGYTSYWITNCLVVQATKETIETIAQRGDVERIELNWKPELIEPVSLPDTDQGELGDPGSANRLNVVPPGIRAINADQVWYDFGIDGTGTLIGGLDTGVDGNHPALASRWRGTSRPASEAWLDLLGSSSFPSDTHGHGTHTMGTMTGRSSTTQDTVGVAWGADWIACNAINQGVGGVFDNDVINAFQWFMNPDGNLGTVSDVPDVVQNSWGINEGFPGGYTDCDTRWWSVIDNCEAAGVVVIFSAGNEGPGAGSHRSPADRATTAHNAFSVGAVDATNFNFPYPIASFSSRGPSGCNVPAELKIKPEVCAPGVTVFSSVPGGGYQSSGWSGTSMAGPHVSGTVALMRQANPDLSVTDIKQILMDTARDEGAAGEDNTYGWGVIDAYAAVEASVTGFGSVEGFVRNASWGDAPISGATVTVIESGRTFGSAGDGSYSGSVAPGTYTLEASHPSFSPQEFEVEVLDGQATVQDFALTDIAGPTITNVSNPISTPDTDGPYLIEATITDFSTVVAANLYVRVNDGAWSPQAMFGLGARYSVALNGLPAGSKIDFYVWAEDGVGLTATNPASAPAEFYTLYITEISYAFDAETADPNWALSAPGDNATTGLWVREDPVGTDSGGPIQTEDDHTPNPGVVCFITGNTPPGGGAGDNDVDNGCTSLVSPIFDLSDATFAFVRYARWFMMGGASTDDVFQVQVSSNGGASWTALETVATFEASWNEVTHRIDDVIPLTSQVQFKWVACDINTQGLTEAAVDDFALEVFRLNPADAPEVAVTAGPSVVLEANAPNPMATVTTLRFRLSNPSRARLVVYDAAGRVVRSLLDERLEAGTHDLQWDGRDNLGRDVEAGVYFYRLEADAFLQSRRLLVVR